MTRKLYPDKKHWNVEGQGAPNKTYEFCAIARKRWIGTKESVADYTVKGKKAAIEIAKKDAIREAVFSANFLADNPKDFEYHVTVRHAGGIWVEAECVLVTDSEPAVERTLDDISHASVVWAEKHEERHIDDGDDEEKCLEMER